MLDDHCPDNHHKSGRTMRSFELMEQLPPEIRECVHEYGMPIVTTLYKHGIRRPGVIHEIVRDIWDGARQPTQRKSAYGSLDWLLVQAGAAISAATLKRFLAEHSLVITTAEPTRAMVEASMTTVSGGGQRMTKYEKHLRRLRAALRAAMTDQSATVTNRVPKVLENAEAQVGG